MVMIMEDNSIFVLWHAPGEPLRAPEVLDSVTALAYDAMMLEPEAYSKIGGVCSTYSTRVCIRSTHR